MKREIDVLIGGIKPQRRRVVVNSRITALFIRDQFPDLDIRDAVRCAEAFGKWHYGERYIATIRQSDVWAAPHWIDGPDGAVLKATFALWEA